MADRQPTDDPRSTKLDGELRALFDDQASELIEPEAAELDAYLEGDLDPADSERLQDRVALSPAAVERLLSQSAPASDVSHRQAVAGVEQVLRRVRQQPTDSATTPATRRRYWPLAAIFAIACLGLGWWAASLQVENQQLTAELARRAISASPPQTTAVGPAAGEADLEDQLAASEIRSGELAEELANARLSLRALQLPRVDLPILDLFPPGSLRGESRSESTIPSGPERVVLIVHAPESAAGSAVLNLQLTDRQGTILWQGKARVDDAGALVLDLPTELIPTTGAVLQLLHPESQHPDNNVLETYVLRLAR